MRRHKWWFIGLGLALLAACAAGWKWGAPPFRFLAKAKLLGFEVQGRYAHATYETAEDVRKVVAAAKSELEAPKWMSWKQEGIFAGPFDWGFSCPPQHEEEVKVSALPEGGTDVSVVLRATATDRLRAWLFGLRGGSR